MADNTPFVTPSQSAIDDEAALAARGELFDGLGRRRIITPDTAGTDKPKLLGYSRCTSWISAIEDQTALTKWRTRLILEGAADADLEGAALTALADRIDDEEDGNPDAGKIYRKRLDEIADYAFLSAGGKDAADYGTSLHRLGELHHDDVLTEEIIAEAEKTWEGITRDFWAYAAGWETLEEKFGARVIMQECLVVNDEKRVAGRADIVASMKLPGDKRARRILVDIKTGKVDNGTRLAQQLAMYAGSKLYDPKTGARTPLRIRQDVAIVAHVPRGEERVEFLLVDLAAGRRANALVEKVRAARRKQPGVTVPLEV